MDAPEEKSWAWTIAQVKSILRDETYISNSVHYRETNVSFKNKHRVRREQIASRRRERKEGATQIFAGLVKCAGCGWYCSSHYIRYDTLYAYVLSRIQFWSNQVHTDEEKLLKKLMSASDKAGAYSLASCIFYTKGDDYEYGMSRHIPCNP